MATDREDRLLLTVVVPAHNSGGMIVSTVERLASRLDGITAEIVVVENGSMDDTWARCIRIAEGWDHVRITFVHLQSAKGMGNALRAGTLASRGSYVLLTADDLPFGFDDIDYFEAALTGGGAVPPFIIGSKAHRDSIVDRGATRGLLTWGFGVLRSSILRMRTGDPQGTLLIEGSLARDLARRAREQGFVFSTELVYLSERMGLTPVEVPVRLTPSHHTHPSRVSLHDMFAMSTGLARLRWRHRSVTPG